MRAEFFLLCFIIYDFCLYLTVFVIFLYNIILIFGEWSIKMKSTNNEMKNKSLAEVVSLSGKLESICLGIMVATIIIGLVDIINIVMNFGGFVNILVYEMNDYQAMITIAGRIFIYIGLVAVEFALSKVVALLNTFATTIFKYSDDEN